MLGVWGIQIATENEGKEKRKERNEKTKPRKVFTWQATGSRMNLVLLAAAGQSLPASPGRGNIYHRMRERAQCQPVGFPARLPKEQLDARYCRVLAADCAIPLSFASAALEGRRGPRGLAPTC